MGIILLIFGMGYHYRNGLAYYFSFKSYNTDEKAAEAKRISDVRNYQVLKNHEGKAIGLDVSEFQDLNPTAENIVVVIWNKIRKRIQSELDLEVVLYETPRNFVTYRGA